MPQASNIVLADAQATPVNHTFIPIGKDPNGVFWYEDQSQASPIGYWKISFEIKRPPAATAGTSSQDRNFRIRVGLHEPALENTTNSTVSGVAPAPTLSYVPRAFAEFVIPERSSLQNRKDLRKMLDLLVAHQTAIDVVEDLEYLW